LFFEKHGVPGLIEHIKAVSKISSFQRQISDEEENLDLTIVRFIDKTILPVSEKITKEKNNPLSWIPITEIYLCYNIIFFVITKSIILFLNC